MRGRLAIPVVVVVLLAGGCADNSGPGKAAGAASQEAPLPVQPTAAPTRAEALVAGRRCGVTLGLAARCNLMRDDRDFAVLRFAVLQGLDRRYGGLVPAREMAETVDLATLDRMTSIAACAVPAQDALRLERGVRSVLAECTGR
jgi:hypothetical protein